MSVTDQWWTFVTTPAQTSSPQRYHNRWQTSLPSSTHTHAHTHTAQILLQADAQWPPRTAWGTHTMFQVCKDSWGPLEVTSVPQVPYDLHYDHGAETKQFGLDTGCKRRQSSPGHVSSVPSAGGALSPGIVCQLRSPRTACRRLARLRGPLQELSAQFNSFSPCDSSLSEMPFHCTVTVAVMVQATEKVTWSPSYRLRPHLTLSRGSVPPGPSAVLGLST